MTDLSCLFDKFMEECRAEGRAERQLEDLSRQREAVLKLLDRKGIDSSAYRADVERVQRVSEAVDLFLDLATAPDPSAFLRERFGH